ncbi:MAG: hypothetical protein EOP43_05050 [Sphingobacteriaceae bacterium]|nr:MAG: hypothetical protein EOP43_05050 [Sphingobacteriaceae bacterium]
MKFRLIFLIICLNSIKTVYSQKAANLPENSKKQLHYGLFFHYLNGLQNTKLPWNQGKVTSWDDCVKDLDVNKLASEVKQLGADYVIITTEQVDKFFCLPNSKYETLTGYKRGDATSHRDLINELYAALNRKGIKLFLYVTGDGPRADDKASKALSNPSIKMTENKGKFLVDEAWVDSWSRIIKSISLQYGKKVTGWWFDGSYNFIGYNNQLLKKYYQAATTGNSSALVAFNFTGPTDTIAVSTIGNYTAGESDKFEGTPTPDFKNIKLKWHLLSYLGNSWGQPGIRYSADYMSAYLKKVKSLQGMVTIDVCLLRDGTIDTAQFNFLKNLSPKNNK